MVIVNTMVKFDSGAMLIRRNIVLRNEKLDIVLYRLLASRSHEWIINDQCREAGLESIHSLFFALAAFFNARVRILRCIPKFNLLATEEYTPTVFSMAKCMKACDQ